MKDLDSKPPEMRNHLDISLLGVCITFLVLIITLKPEILSSYIPFTIQLSLAIPLFICSLLSRIHHVKTPELRAWDNLSFICFTLGFGFLINIIGIVLAIYTPIYVAILFFVTNFILATIRSELKVYYHPKKRSRRLFRDLIYLIILIVGGLLPILKVF